MTPSAADHHNKGGLPVTHLPPSPFMFDPDRRFVLDTDAFEAAIAPRIVTPSQRQAIHQSNMEKLDAIMDEAAPVFLSDPSPDYLGNVLPAADFHRIDRRSEGRGSN